METCNNQYSKEEKFTNVIWLDSATIFDKKIILFKYLIAYYGLVAFLYRFN